MYKPITLKNLTSITKLLFLLNAIIDTFPICYFFFFLETIGMTNRRPQFVE